MAKVNALMFDVYRPADVLETGEDYTNGGITSQYARILVLHPEGPQETDSDNPKLCRLVSRDLGEGAPVVHLEPVNGKRPGAVGWQFGGNFAYTSDSRARDLIGFYGAVPVHDRQEGGA